MKVSIKNKEELWKQLSKVTSIVKAKNSEPILDNICLEVQGDYLTMRATDMEVSIETSLQVEEKEEEGGATTVVAKSFEDIIRTLPSHTKVHLHSKENNWLSIRCDKSKFNIAGRSIEEYPALPKFSEHDFYSLDIDSFKTMVDYTSFAAGKDESRYQMTGMYLGFVESKSTDSCMVATDGHRLAYCEKKLFLQEISFLKEREEGFIIPEKGIKNIRSLLDDEAELMLACDNKHLIFKVDKTYILARLIEGQYPDYKRIIPKEMSNSFRINKQKLFESIKSVSCITNEDFIGIKIKLEKGNLEISTNNPTLGEGNVSLEADYDGESMEIAFNSKYLNESISVIKEEKVDILFSAYNRPGVIRVPESNYVSVLMPMRI